MTRFMGQGEDVVEYLWLVIHQDVWIPVKGTTAEGTTMFSLVRISLAPPSQQPVLQRSRVIRSQWLQRLNDQFDSLVPTAMSCQVTEDGDVRVVMVNVIQLHLATSYVVVMVKGWQV